MQRLTHSLTLIPVEGVKIGTVEGGYRVDFLYRRRRMTLTFGASLLASE